MEENWDKVQSFDIPLFVIPIPSTREEESLFLEIMRKKLLNSHKISLKRIPRTRDEKIKKIQFVNRI